MEYKLRRVTRRNKRLKAIMKGSIAVMLAGGIVLGVTLNYDNQNREAANTINTEMYETATSTENIEANEPEISIEETPIEEVPIEETITPKYNFTELKEQYPDIVGFIEGDILSEPYPVVADDFSSDYYLKHLPDGTRNNIGSVCFNDASKPDLTDDFSIIYAHNIEGTMFSGLHNYRQEGYNAPMYYYSEYGEYLLEPIATAVQSESYFQYGSFDDDVKQAIIDEMYQNASVKTGLEVTPEDNIVTLYTCLNHSESDYYTHPDYRVMVYFKITPLVLYNQNNYQR